MELGVILGDETILPTANASLGPAVRGAGTRTRTILTAVSLGND